MIANFLTNMSQSAYASTQFITTLLLAIGFIVMISKMLEPVGNVALVINFLLLASLFYMPYTVESSLNVSLLKKDSPYILQISSTSMRVYKRVDLGENQVRNPSPIQDSSLNEKSRPASALLLKCPQNLSLKECVSKLEPLNLEANTESSQVIDVSSNNQTKE